ncbi:MAG: hypothetical protein COB02_05865 [Candidatus Cloacimonadota bacterium]|nr:MAG: hypothetical protein COB02_12225 [Candidatus Cloacimonadota bacterium]PCJ20124.1 MAG: hypothetical protein COB02_05865 [Candidatus Cloacimonadota bacterium]
MPKNFNMKKIVILLFSLYLSTNVCFTNKSKEINFNNLLQVFGANKQLKSKIEYILPISLSMSYEDFFLKVGKLFSND